MGGTDIVAGECVEMIPVGSEVVVDHVEDDHQPQRVGAIDKRPRVVRRSVEPRWCEQVDAIVAPAETAREIGDGHDLKHRDAELRQRGQLSHRRPPGAASRERAEVQFVNDVLVRRATAPFGIGPGERRRIDDL